MDSYDSQRLKESTNHPAPSPPQSVWGFHDQLTQPLSLEFGPDPKDATTKTTKFVYIVFIDFHYVLGDWGFV